MSRGGLALRVLAVGLLVAGIVTATAARNSGLCASHPEGACDDLVRMLSLRMGVVSGLVTVLVLLMMVGLARMVAMDEDRRSRPEPSD